MEKTKCQRATGSLAQAGRQHGGLCCGKLKVNKISINRSEGGLKSKKYEFKMFIWS